MNAALNKPRYRCCVYREGHAALCWDQTTQIHPYFVVANKVFLLESACGGGGYELLLSPLSETLNEAQLGQTAAGEL